VVDALSPELVNDVPLDVPTEEYVPPLVLERYTVYEVAPLDAVQVTVREDDVALPTVSPVGADGALPLVSFFHTAQLLPLYATVHPVPGDQSPGPIFIAVLLLMIAAYLLESAT